MILVEADTTLITVRPITGAELTGGGRIIYLWKNENRIFICQVWAAGTRSIVNSYLARHMTIELREGTTLVFYGNWVQFKCYAYSQSYLRGIKVLVYYQAPSLLAV